jgi:hypothetical protein
MMVSERNKIIHKRRKAGETNTVLARAFGISRTRVRQIFLAMEERENLLNFPIPAIEYQIKKAMQEERLSARAGNAVLRYVSRNEGLTVEQLKKDLEDDNLTIRGLGEKQQFPVWKNKEEKS